MSDTLDLGPRLARTAVGPRTLPVVRALTGRVGRRRGGLAATPAVLARAEQLPQAGVDCALHVAPGGP